MRVLLLDESEDFRNLMAQILAIEWPEAEIDEFALCDEFLMDDSPLAPAYDIALLDYRVIEGFQAMCRNAARGVVKAPPAIVLSDANDAYVAAQAMKLGAAAFLRKQDVDRKRLGQTVREVIAAVAAEQERDFSATCDLSTEYGKVSSPHNAFGVTIPGYTLRSKIGQGGMASVFLCERNRDGLNLVLKVMHGQLAEDKTFLTRFVQEYNVLSRIDSPYVVRIHEQGATDHHIFIAMEYFPRGNLKQYLRTMTPLRALRIYCHIIKGLSVVHDVGVAHRDLKPENIMFREDGSLALVDFGIAKRLDDTLQITRDGEVCGTPYYMSPEQVSGGPVDVRSDLYAAGAILFEMLECRKVYTGNSAIEVAAKHVHAPMPKLSAAFNELQPIIERTLAKDPANRYQNARQALPDAVRALTKMRTSN